MTTTQTVPQGKDTATQGELYVSFELGDKSWKLTMSDGRRGRTTSTPAIPPRYWIAFPRHEHAVA